MALDANNRTYRFVVLFFNCQVTFGCYFCFDMPSVLQDKFTGSINSNCTDGNKTMNITPHCNVTCDDCLGMTDDNYNLLYAIYAWTNAFIVLGAGFLVDKMENRISLILFSFLCVLGSSAFAVGSMLKGTSAMLPIMLLGRLLFGAGNGTLHIVRNRVTVYWFKDKELALAYGITLAVSRLGSVLNFFVTQKFESKYGLTWTLWAGAILIGVGFISANISGFLDTYGVKQLGDAEKLKTDSKKMRVADIRHFTLSYWLLAFSIAFFYNGVFPFVADSRVHMTNVGIRSENLTKMSIFLHMWRSCWLLMEGKFIATKYDYSDSTSSYIAGSMFDVTLLSAPFLGGIVDVIGKRGYLATSCALLTIPVYVLLAFTSVLPLVSTILLGVTYSIAATSMLPSIPLVVSHAKVGTAMGIAKSIQMFGVGISNLVVGQILGKDQGDTPEALQRWRNVMIFLLANISASCATSICLNINDKRESGVLNLSRREKSQTAQKLLSSETITVQNSETEPLLKTSEKNVK